MESKLKNKTIAVLPFVNRSSQVENEYFSDGITEEIINALTKIKQLKIISRTSSFYFKNHKESVSDIGKKLNAAIIVQGSVRISEDLLRITAQLIDVENDFYFWSETWDRKFENIFEIQDEISLMIADKLREHLGHLDISDHLVESPTKNLSAYDYFLKGRYHYFKWNPEDTKIAIDQFERALNVDNNLIDAHLSLADSYNFLAIAGFAPREEAWAKVQNSLKTAKALDSNNSGLNYLLASQAFFTDANYQGAMKYGLKSLEHKPASPETHRFMSFLFGLSGDMKKSKEHLLYAKSIDPLNQETKFFEAYFYYRSRKYAKASPILNNLLKENSKNLPALILNIYIQIKEKLSDKAKESINNIPYEMITPDERLGLLCLLEITNNHPHSSMIAELEKNAQDDSSHHAHAYLFVVYAFLGKFKKAYSVLQKLFDVKSSILLLNFSDPLAENIFSDPEYKHYHEMIYNTDLMELKQKKTTATILDDQKAKLLLSKLYDYTNFEKPYLNPSLTLRLLANQIEIHPNQLSWLINEYVGKNFNEFINLLRIKHFKEIVVDPSNANISLIGLAYESGFNSKTVFNTTFKKEVGMTPKEYQKNQSKHKN